MDPKIREMKKEIRRITDKKLQPLKEAMERRGFKLKETEHVVITRDSSDGEIFQRNFPNYDEAKEYFDIVKESNFFCRLCKTVESNR